MFAGKMKLNHFLMIALAASLAGIAGLYFACRGGDDGDDGKRTASHRGDKQPAQRKLPAATDRPTLPSPAEQPLPLHGEPDVPPAAPTPGMRELDRTLLAWADKDLGSAKKKDVTKGRAYKINLYQDAGKSSVSRAKVDLDRDEKWDEKWTFDGTNISRKVAPADDENYNQSFVWNGTEWVVE